MHRRLAGHDTALAWETELGRAEDGNQVLGLIRAFLASRPPEELAPLLPAAAKLAHPNDIPVLALAAVKKSCEADYLCNGVLQRVASLLTAATRRIVQLSSRGRVILRP
jgi:hypothetical protein